MWSILSRNDLVCKQLIKRQFINKIFLYLKNKTKLSSLLAVFFEIRKHLI